eukprot:9475503-Pyramimonas_sp.AAC.2
MRRSGRWRVGGNTHGLDTGGTAIAAAISIAVDADVDARPAPPLLARAGRGASVSARRVWAFGLRRAEAEASRLALVSPSARSAGSTDFSVLAVSVAPLAAELGCAICCAAAELGCAIWCALGSLDPSWGP